MSENERFVTLIATQSGVNINMNKSWRLSKGIILKSKWLCVTSSLSLLQQKVWIQTDLSQLWWLTEVLTKSFFHIHSAYTNIHSDTI